MLAPTITTGQSGWGIVFVVKQVLRHLMQPSRNSGENAIFWLWSKRDCPFFVYSGDSGLSPVTPKRDSGPEPGCRRAREEGSQQLKKVS